MKKPVLTLIFLLSACPWLQGQTPAQKAVLFLRTGQPVSAPRLSDAERASLVEELRQIATDPNPQNEWRSDAEDRLVRAGDPATLKQVVARYESDQFGMHWHAHSTLEDCYSYALIPLIVGDVFKDEREKRIREDDVSMLPNSFSSAGLIMNVLRCNPQTSPEIETWVRANAVDARKQRDAVRSFWTLNKAALLAGQYGSLVVPP